MLPSSEVGEEWRGAVVIDREFGIDAANIVRRVKNGYDEECSQIYFQIEGNVYGGLEVYTMEEFDGYLLTSLDGTQGELVEEGSDEDVIEDLLDEVRNNAVLSYLEEKGVEEADLDLKGERRDKDVELLGEAEWNNHSFHYATLESCEGETILSGDVFLTEYFR